MLHGMSNKVSEWCCFSHPSVITDCCKFIYQHLLGLPQWLEDKAMIGHTITPLTETSARPQIIIKTKYLIESFLWKIEIDDFQLSVLQVKCYIMIVWHLGRSKIMFIERFNLAALDKRVHLYSDYFKANRHQAKFKVFLKRQSRYSECSARTYFMLLIV